jgi:hypothetical protein
VPTPEHSAPNDERAAVQISFDSSSQVWIPMAMLAALCLATPLAWSKRLVAVLIGAVVVQVFATATVWAGVSYSLLSQRSPGNAPLLLTFADHFLSDNIWVSFVLPLLIWVVWLAGGGHWVELRRAVQGFHLRTCIPEPGFGNRPKLSNDLSQVRAKTSKSAPAKAGPKIAVGTSPKL